MNTRDTSIKLNILGRLIDTKQLSFDIAFMAVFSDYPSKQFCLELIKTGLVSNENILDKLIKVIAE